MKRKPQHGGQERHGGVVTGRSTEQEFAEKVGRRHGGATRASLLRHFARRQRHSRAEVLPLILRRPLAGRRGHERREACNGRSKGSRRGAGTSSRGSPGGDDPPDDPEPPGLKLWRHPRFGSCTPNLIRIAIGEDA